MTQRSGYLKYSLHIVILGGLIWAIVEYVDGQAVLRALQAFDQNTLPIVLALAIIFMVVRGMRFLLLIHPFAKKVQNWVIFKGYLSGQAAVLLPGGIAARAGLMNQVGVPVAQSSVPVAFHSGWDQVLFLLGGMVAALWFPAARLPVLIVLGGVTAVSILLTISTTRSLLATAAKTIAAKLRFESQWQRFLDAVPQVLTSKIVVGSFVITAVTFALQLLILGLILNGLALNVPLPTLFLAFIVPTMLGRILPVPGGFGVTEAGMVGFLTSTAQLGVETAVAAVAIFRVLIIVLPAVIGALVYLFLWKGGDETASVV